MGITTKHLRKLGFKEANKVFLNAKDRDTLVYHSSDKDWTFILPKGKTVILIVKNIDFETSNLIDENKTHRFIMMDEIGYFEFQRFLRSLRKVKEPIPPRNLIID